MSTSPSSAHQETLRPDLAETLFEFDLQANQAGLVGQFIAPVIEVAKPFGQYPVVKLKELLKKRDTRRQNDGSYARGDGKGDKDTYFTEEHGFEEPVDDREAEMYGDWWDAEQLAAERTRDVVLRNYDERIVNMVTNASVVTAAPPETALGWNQPNSKPIDDVTAARIACRNRTGFVPNVMVLEWEAYEHLRSNEQIIERLKYSGHTNPNKDNITEMALAQALALDEVKVANAMTNTANENKAAQLAAQWPAEKALLFVRNTSRNTMRPRFASTFHWGADGSTIGATFESYYSQDRRRWMIRHRLETGEKLIYKELGQIITDVLTEGSS